jgi:hypothetical protein
MTDVGAELGRLVSGKTDVGLEAQTENADTSGRPLRFDPR